jgi:glucosyl-3-phosphoglycerate synthase
MISVVIPVLNEAPTVASVVAFVRQHPLVGEVLVIDDGSIDGTPDIARAAGAVVLTSTLLGKGASMADGLREARYRTLLYLDGDLRELHPDLVSRMTGPLLRDEADFVKAKFTRSAGRVTLLTARPLLRTFFPELAHFEQPLGGIVAADRSLLRRLRFENDYGVDVGLLLDAAARGARLAEVDIGHLEHDSQPLENLGEMATQVVRAILTRAARRGRLNARHIDAVREEESLVHDELAEAVRRADGAERLALFDMDGTLLHGRFVLELAHRTRRGPALARYLDRHDIDPDDRARRIAALFADVPRTTFEETVMEMPLMPGARETVLALRKAGYRVGIVSDSYRVAVEIVRRRVFADFAVAHLMRFRGGRALGEVVLSRALTHPHGCPLHSCCKLNLLLHLTERLNIPLDDVLAVGDGENDVCMLQAAGTSVAFRPTRARVRAAAQFVVDGALTDVLPAVLPEEEPDVLVAT